MKYAKYLTFIPLVAWIILFTVLVAVVVYFTQLKFLYVLLFISIFCLFDLIWWALVMNDKTILDRFTIFSFLIVLNFPAYWLAKKARKYAIQEEIKKTGHAKNLITPELDVANELLPTWEKKIIAQKQAKKLVKKPQKIQAQYLHDQMFTLQRLVMNAYCQFVLFQVLKAHPHLTQTFEITKLVKEQVLNPTQKKETILDFSQESEQWVSIDWKEYSSVKTPLKYVIDVLNETSGAELMVVYKQFRVDNTLEVKSRLSKTK